MKGNLNGEWYLKGLSVVDYNSKGILMVFELYNLSGEGHVKQKMKGKCR